MLMRGYTSLALPHHLSASVRPIFDCPGSTPVIAAMRRETFHQSFAVLMSPRSLAKRAICRAV